MRTGMHFRRKRWFNTMDSRTDCWNCWFSKPGWWWPTHSEGQDTVGGEYLKIFRVRLVRISLSQVIYLHATGPKVQEVQHVTNTHWVRWEFAVVHRVYIDVWDLMTWRLTCCVLCSQKCHQVSHIYSSQKYHLNWGLQKLREVWTNNFIGDPSRDEDDFEKQLRLDNESDKTTVRPSPSQVQVDQLEGILEKPIPYISFQS
jgi:hypothetical protein